MPALIPFDQFIRELRDASPDAERHYAQTYEPVVRLEMQLHVTNPDERDRFEQLALVPAVLDCVARRLRLGQFDLEIQGDLVAVLRRATLAMIASERTTGQLTAQSRTQVAACDDIDAILAHLMPEEREIVRLRRNGRGWDEIGQQVGCPANGCRRQLARAIADASRRLQWPDVDPDAAA